MSSLDTGFAFNLFREWSKEKQNMVILPDRGPIDSFARELYEIWKAQTMDINSEEAPIISLDIEKEFTVLLSFLLKM
jgi:hypothetical protein